MNRRDEKAKMYSKFIVNIVCEIMLYIAFKFILCIYWFFIPSWDAIQRIFNSLMVAIFIFAFFECSVCILSKVYENKKVLLKFLENFNELYFSLKNDRMFENFLFLRHDNFHVVLMQKNFSTFFMFNPDIEFCCILITIRIFRSCSLLLF